MATKIKFCAMTNAEDAQLAASLGVDAIGLIFYPPSIRSVTIEQAQTITKNLPPFLSIVGVFVDPEIDYIKAILQQVPLNLLQFHGQESESFCCSFERPYIKTIALGKDSSNPTSIIAEYPSARGFLLDTYHPNLKGGTGQPFDWQLIPHNIDCPIILAGGLNSDNVKTAVTKVKPYAVDVVSGIEQAPGRKDPNKMREFIKILRSL